MNPDLRFALRQLLRNPGFTAVAVISLAMGIGANTAIFNVLNATFLRALPYPRPDRLVFFSERTGAGDSIPVSYPNFLDWKQQQDAFSGMAFFHNASGRLKTGRGTEGVTVQHVSAEFFRILGVRPLHGREMRPEDDLPGAERVAWVTDDSWRRFFSRDPDLVGRSVVLDGRSLTVVGILPEDFRFLRPADVFTAIAPFVGEYFLDMRESHSNGFAIGRLKDGADFESARAQMDTIARRLSEDYREANKGLGIATLPLRAQLVGGTQRQFLFLFGAVVLVQLIACGNVANMLLARSFARTREMAIRSSLGASRLQLMRQLLVESVVLATAGGVIGALVGWWGFNFVSRLVPDQIQRMLDVGSFDIRPALFLTVITLATGIAFGLFPSWQLSHACPVDALKSTTRGLRTFLGRFRLSGLLVVGQTSLALVLLIAAGLMIRSLNRLLDVDPGFEPSRVLTLEVGSPPVEQFKRDPGSFARHFEKVLESVRTLPEVEVAAVASGLPFSGNDNFNSFYREDRPIPEAGQFPSASQHTVSPEYFRAMGIALLRGRVFDGTEPAFALVGLYGVLAFNVGRRTREIGIRMALGANRWHVVRGIVGRGLTLLLPALALGLGFGWAVSRILRSQLFGIGENDPVTFSVSASLMVGIALLATCLPAFRAARVEPTESLRCE